ncbi:MAG TPA: hypothetical protein VF960_05780 [Chloroflexota bacterium]
MFSRLRWPRSSPSPECAPQACATFSGVGVGNAISDAGAEHLVMNRDPGFETRAGLEELDIPWVVDVLEGAGVAVP